MPHYIVVTPVELSEAQILALQDLGLGVFQQMGAEMGTYLNVNAARKFPQLSMVWKGDIYAQSNGWLGAEDFVEILHHVSKFCQCTTDRAYEMAITLSENEVRMAYGWSNWFQVAYMSREQFFAVLSETLGQTAFGLTRNVFLKIKRKTIPFTTYLPRTKKSVSYAESVKHLHGWNWREDYPQKNATT